MYANEFAKKYEDLIKKFLANKLQNHALDTKRITEIIAVAKEKTASIASEEDIEKALVDLESHFEEMKELEDKVHFDNESHKQAEKDKVISDIATKLVGEDIHKAQEVLNFNNNNPHASLDEFFVEFPDYRVLANIV